jgi:redox-sensitive bicupin YhaK (pirin superfamily)
MSVRPALEPTSSASPERVVDAIIDARPRDLGGFAVRRVLPAPARRMVGPFTFLDQMGAADFAPGQGLDVPPHPHIGLATVTYLYEGAILHRDSLGSEQVIRPGDVNWMTAGRGIVHSERTPAELRGQGGRLHGLQLWVALPTAHEEIAPSFQHHGRESLPERELGGVRVRVVAGTAYELTSPVELLSPLFHVDAVLPAGSELALPDGHEQRAVYVVDGALGCGAERAEAGRMLVFARDARVVLRAEVPTRLALLGGAPLDGPRYMDWNFVASSKARLAQARADWRERRFPLVPGDEHDFIPGPAT